MKTFKKLLPILIALTAIADTHFELLKSVRLSESEINLIKLIGLGLSLFLPSVQTSFFKRQSFADDNTDPMPSGTPRKKF